MQQQLTVIVELELGPNIGVIGLISTVARGRRHTVSRLVLERHGRVDVSGVHAHAAAWVGLRLPVVARGDVAPSRTTVNAILV